MIKTGRPLEVRIVKFTAKLDSEGGKWYKVGLSLLLGDSAAVVLQAQGAAALKLMGQNAKLDEVIIDDQMESVRLEFSPVSGQEPDKIISSTELFDFVLSRETATQAGTLKKEKSGRIALDFSFNAPMMTIANWIEERFGNMVQLKIEKAQTELALQSEAPAEPDDPDSQEARNLRIINDEAKQAEEISAGGKEKKSRKKKDTAASE